MVSDCNFTHYANIFSSVLCTLSFSAIIVGVAKYLSEKIQRKTVTVDGNVSDCQAIALIVCSELEPRIKAALAQKTIDTKELDRLIKLAEKIDRAQANHRAEAPDAEPDTSSSQKTKQGK